MSDYRVIAVARRVLAAVLMTVATACGVMSAEGDDRLPDFSEHVAADRSSYLFMSDMAPAVRRFLTAPRLARLIGEMPGADGNQNADAVLREFDEGAVEFVPDQMFLGISDKGVAGLSRLIPLMMRFGLCDGVIQSGEVDSLEELHQGLIKDLREVRISDIDLWLRFRTESTAIGIESQIQFLAGRLASEGQLKADIKPERINISLSVGDFVPAELITGFLFSMNMTDDFSDPDLQVAADIIADMNLRIGIRRIGPAMLIQLGSSGKAADEKLDPPSGKLWTEDSGMLLYAKYSTTAFRTQVEATRKLWERYRETPIGKAVSDADTEDLIGALNDVAEALGTEDAAGEMRVQLSDKLTIDLQETGATAVQSLADSEVLQFVPKSASAWIVSSESSLGDIIRNVLSSFEDRLATITARTELSGDSDNSAKAALAEQINEFYYTNLREFRRLIREESRNVFAAPVAMITGEQMQNETFRVRFRHNRESNVVTLENVPVISLAVVTKLSPQANLKEFLSRLQSAFIGAWKDAPELKLSESSTLEGIEGPVEIISGEWLPQVLPDQMRVEAEGTALLHGLITGDGWLILSTSPELTRNILAASKQPSVRKSFSEETEANVLSLSISGATVTETVFLPIHWMELLILKEDMVSAEGTFAQEQIDRFHDSVPRLRNIARIIGLLRELVAGIDEIRMDARITEGTRIFQCTMTFHE